MTEGRQVRHSGTAFRTGLYRPFTKQAVCFSRQLNDMVYRQELFFPSPQSSNLGIYNVGMGSGVPFSVLMTDVLPDLHVTGAGSGGQFFPRWTYARIDDESLDSGKPTMIMCSMDTDDATT